MSLNAISGMLQGRFPREYYMDSLSGDRKMNADDKLTGIEQCRKKIDLSSNVPGASALVAVFCVEHGHCFGFHVVPLEGDLDFWFTCYHSLFLAACTGRRDPFLLMLAHMEHPPEVVYFDFACAASYVF